jgi:hypothetical protein
MKNVLNLTWLVVVLTLGGWMQQTFASHVAGGEITYTYVSRDNFGRAIYDLRLTLLRDCGGNPLGPTQKIYLNSPGVFDSVNVTRIGLEEVTPLCDPTWSCGTGGVTIYEKHTFEGQVALRLSSLWVLEYKLCCRNNAINTLNSPGNTGFSIVTSFNNQDYPTNSSPTFPNPPLINSCLNFDHPQGGIDRDGNQISYRLTTPMGFNYFTNINAPVTFLPQYSQTNPISGSFNLDNSTGRIYGLATGQNIGVFAVKAIEKDAQGNVISTITRDFQINLINCTNQAPTASPTTINQTICVGKPYTLAINAQDADTDPQKNKVTMSWGNEIPGASFNITNNNSSNPFPTGTFQWTPTANDVGTHFFTVTVKDNHCPYVGINFYTK